MPEASSQFELLTESHARAVRLLETLRRHESDLAGATLLDPATREAGLAAVRKAAQKASQLADDTYDALRRRNAIPAAPDSQFPGRGPD